MEKNKKDDIKIIRIYPCEYPSLTKDEIFSHIKNILNFNLRKEINLPSEIEIVLMYKNKQKKEKEDEQ